MNEYIIYQNHTGGETIHNFFIFFLQCQQKNLFSCNFGISLRCVLIVLSLSFSYHLVVYIHIINCSLMTKVGHKKDCDSITFNTLFLMGSDISWDQDRKVQDSHQGRLCHHKIGGNRGARQYRKQQKVVCVYKSAFPTYTGVQ